MASGAGVQKREDPELLKLAIEVRERTACLLAKTDRVIGLWVGSMSQKPKSTEATPPMGYLGQLGSLLQATLVDISEIESLIPHLDI